MRELVLPLLRDSPEAFLLVDDRVQYKRYSRIIDVAKRQYPGNAHGMVTGIGLVNLVHSSEEAGDFLPRDYRVYAPNHDGQTKNDHFLALFDQALSKGKLLFSNILFDSWYAGSTNLKRIHRAGVDVFHDPSTQPVDEPDQRKRLPGTGYARTATPGLEPGRGSAPERSALWGKALQASGHERRH